MSLSLYNTKLLSLTRSSLQQTTKRLYSQNPKPKQFSTSSSSASNSNPITSFPKDHPFAFQLLVATGKTSAADIVVQVVAEKKKWNEIDWKRNGIFVVFGFACKFHGMHLFAKWILFCFVLMCMTLLSYIIINTILYYF
jgi:hypothetical protein